MHLSKKIVFLYAFAACIAFLVVRLVRVQIHECRDRVSAVLTTPADERSTVSVNAIADSDPRPIDGIHGTVEIKLFGKIKPEDARFSGAVVLLADNVRKGDELEVTLHMVNSIPVGSAADLNDEMLPVGKKIAVR